MAEPLADISPKTLSPALLEAANRAQLGILVTERNGDILKTVFANAALSALLGYDADELRGLNIAALAVPEDQATILHLSAELRLGREVPMPFELRARRKNGQMRELECSNSLVREGERTLMVSFLRDVTPRKEAERKAAAVDAEFRRYMERAPDSVVISRGGIVLWANSAAARALAYGSSEELKGANLLSMLGPAEAQELVQRLTRLVQTGEPAPPFEYNARRKDGTLSRAETSSVLVQWEGQPAVFSVIRDISDRARVLTQLAQTDRLAALGMLAAGVAHEINSPMAAVLFAVEGVERMVMRRGTEALSSDEVLKLLAELRRSALQVTRIVKELRAFSRGGDESVSAVDLRPVVEAANHLAGPSVRDTAQLLIVLEGVPRVMGNAERLEQVLVNLLINASQAMPPERAPADNRIAVSFEVQAARVALVVRDNGAGIPPHILGRIFEPFFTTKPIGVGTGLGLSICHGIIKNLGGELAVESTPGEGTTVRVLLRRAD